MSDDDQDLWARVAQNRKARARAGADPTRLELTGQVLSLPVVATWAERLGQLQVTGFDQQLRQRLEQADGSIEELERVAREVAADLLLDRLKLLISKDGKAILKSVVRAKYGRHARHWRGADDLFQVGCMRASGQIQRFRSGSDEIPVDTNIRTWFWLTVAGAATHPRRKLEEDAMMIEVAGPADRADSPDPVGRVPDATSDRRLQAAEALLSEIGRARLLMGFREYLARADDDPRLHSPEYATESLRRQTDPRPAFLDAAHGFMGDLLSAPHEVTTFDDFSDTLVWAMRRFAPARYESSNSAEQRRRRERAHVNHLVQSFLRAVGDPDARVPELDWLARIATAHQLYLVTDRVTSATNEKAGLDLISRRTEWLRDLIAQSRQVGSDVSTASWREATLAHLHEPETTTTLRRRAEGAVEGSVEKSVAEKALAAVTEVQAMLLEMNGSIDD